MTRPRRRIAVLLGGRSSEHEVSLASAQSVIAALAENHDVVTVEIGRDGSWALGRGEEHRSLPNPVPDRVPSGDGKELEPAANRLPDRGVSTALAEVDVRIGRHAA